VREKYSWLDAGWWLMSIWYGIKILLVGKSDEQGRVKKIPS
jgi:hypothetical protein